MSQSGTSQFREKLPGDHPDYQRVVAIPTMAAVDSMPPTYRSLVHEYGYVDVYRAWRRGMSANAIRTQGMATGKFEL